MALRDLHAEGLLSHVRIEPVNCGVCVSVRCVRSSADRSAVISWDEFEENLPEVIERLAASALESLVK